MLFSFYWRHRREPRDQIWLSASGKRQQPGGRSSNCRASWRRSRPKSLGLLVVQRPTFGLERIAELAIAAPLNPRVRRNAFSFAWRAPVSSIWLWTACCAAAIWWLLRRLIVHLRLLSDSVRGSLPHHVKTRSGSASMGRSPGH